MTKQQFLDTTFHTALGFTTAGGVAKFLLDSSMALLLGMIGAIGGWIAGQFIIPLFKKWITQLKQKKWKSIRSLLRRKK